MAVARMRAEIEMVFILLDRMLVVLFLGIVVGFFTVGVYTGGVGDPLILHVFLYIYLKSSTET